MDIDGGWSKTPHAILQAMPDMSLPELACTMLLVRETYGWHRPRARLTYADFTRLTNVQSKSAVAVALQRIEARGFFRRTETRSVWAIGETGTAEAGAADGAGRERNPHEAEQSSLNELRRELAGLERTIAELRRAIGALNGAESEQDDSASQAQGSEIERLGPVLALASSKSEPGGSVNAADGSKIEPGSSVSAADGSKFEPGGSVNAADGSKFEPGSSLNGLEGLESEPGGPVTCLERSEIEPHRSVIALEGSEIEGIRAIGTESLDGNRPPNGPKTPANGSPGGRKNEANGSFRGSFPFNKDKGSPSGKEREGERKADPRPPAPPPAAVLAQGRQEGRAAGRKRDPAGSGRRRARRAKHTTPRPRSRKEMLLASHPAAAAWLEVGLEWPGWQRLKIVTQRIGSEPQLERLRQAREMWLMAGYRMENIDGILDWYEELCRDPLWRPFTRAKEND